MYLPLIKADESDEKAFFSADAETAGARTMREVPHQYDYEQHTEVLMVVAVMGKEEEEEEEEEEEKAAQRIIRNFDPR